MAKIDEKVIGAIRSEILETDPKFGKKCLDYFDSLNLSRIEISPSTIEGKVDLEDNLKFDNIFTNIVYGVSAGLRSVPEDVVGGPLFRIFIEDNTSSLNYFKGWISVKKISYEGKTDFSLEYSGLRVGEKFFEEMKKAYEALRS